MSKRSEYRDVKVMGIDLAKNSFHVHGVDADSRKAVGKKLSRQKLKECLVNLPPCIVAMEACAGAHYWARLSRSYGHEVRLIAPQFVKPYVKSNKNDAVDAEAIAEAVQRPNMRFVAIKTIEQQDCQSVHRVRSQAVKNRTALVNQIRGLLLENGVDKSILNIYGSTALISVAGPFNEVKPIYDEFAKGLGPLGLKLDYEQLEKTRPIIAEMLK